MKKYRVKKDRYTKLRDLLNSKIATNTNPVEVGVSDLEWALDEIKQLRYALAMEKDQDDIIMYEEGS